jgi:hypothetical protein
MTFLYRRECRFFSYALIDGAGMPGGPGLELGLAGLFLMPVIALI